MSYIDELGKKAKSAAKNSAMLSQSLKNDILATIAAMLENGRDEIKKANELDITAAHENNIRLPRVWTERGTLPRSAFIFRRIRFENLWI